MGTHKARPYAGRAEYLHNEGSAAVDFRGRGSQTVVSTDGFMRHRFIDDGAAGLGRGRPAEGGV